MAAAVQHRFSPLTVHYAARPFSVVAVVAFRFDREPMRPLWSLPLQQFVYRQLLYLALLKSVGTALAGVALRWQKIARTGAAAAHLSRTADVGDQPSPVAALPR